MSEGKYEHLYWDGHGNGNNMKRGSRQTAESRQKISECQTGVPKTAEHREHIAEGMRRAWAARRMATALARLTVTDTDTATVTATRPNRNEGD